MSVPDPYKTLQVDPEAEEEVIEAAYRRLARKYHPDVSPGPESEARMVRINQAWELLRDPIRRAAVDRARARASAVPQGSSGYGPGPASPAARPSPRPAASPGGQPPRPSSPGTGSPAWPFPGMRDPHDDDARHRRSDVARDWTTGRSTVGGGYDPSTMGTPQGAGSAGPPPGKPSGTVLNFGRYEAWSLGEIARVDLEYLEWLDRMPIGRPYHHEIDALLRSAGRRKGTAADEGDRRGLHRRR